MDVKRTDLSQAKKRKRVLAIAASVAAAALIAILLSQLEPAAPAAESASLYLSTVERGEMLRQVRGPGSLVPENLQWIAAASDGLVERVLVLPGTEVTADTVVLELSNSELAQQTMEAESGLRAAEADYLVLRAQLESQVLTQESFLAQVVSEHSAAHLELEANEKLAEEGLLPDINFKQSRLATEQLEKRVEIEGQRLERTRASAEAQLEAQQSRLDQLRALHQLRQDQLAALRVVAGMDGVLQEVRVEEGQRVTPGTTLARVAQPGRLKAELRIPETQARDLTLGQKTVIDTRNGVIDGSVIRIDPAVREGSVTVDIKLEGDLPRGARPDLTVDGTIEIERLESVLYVGRPAYGQAHQTISLFRLDADGEHAHRVRVELGRASVSTIEILAGLEAGDRVILSDTSSWDDHDRIRLN